MEDLNFFESYLDKRSLNISQRLICYWVVILLFVSLTLYTISSQIKIRKISKDIVKLESVIQDERINSKIKEMESIEERTKELKTSLKEIEFLDDILEDMNIIDDSLLESITSRMPEKLFFTSIDITLDNIEIIGVAEDRQSIAELGKNLETIQGSKGVFISSISKEEIYYNFNLNIALKDVNMDDEDETNKASKDEETAE